MLLRRKQSMFVLMLATALASLFIVSCGEDSFTGREQPSRPAPTPTPVAALADIPHPAHRPASASGPGPGARPGADAHPVTDVPLQARRRRPTPTPTPTPTPGVMTISIVGMAGANSYSPNPVTVQVGQQVRWRNDDNTAHTATGAAFDTGIDPSGRDERARDLQHARHPQLSVLDPPDHGGHV